MHVHRSTRLHRSVNGGPPSAVPNHSAHALWTISMRFTKARLLKISSDPLLCARWLCGVTLIVLVGYVAPDAAWITIDKTASTVSTTMRSIVIKYLFLKYRVCILQRVRCWPVFWRQSWWKDAHLCRVQDITQLFAVREYNLYLYHPFHLPGARGIWKRSGGWTWLRTKQHKGCT